MVNFHAARFADRAMDEVMALYEEKHYAPASVFTMVELRRILYKHMCAFYDDVEKKRQEEKSEAAKGNKKPQPLMVF